MKTQTNRKPSNQGSALVITLVLVTIMLLTAASYLQLLGTQKTIVVRSESWNASLIMAEAGVEEGLAQANSNPNNLLTTNDFSGNSWGFDNNNQVFGPMTHSVQGGKYIASISNTAPPVIYASGMATVPVSGDTITRKVRVGTKKQVFSNLPMGAKGNIDMKGNGIAVDSWNSRDPNWSTAGVFDPKKTSTNGDVASLGGLVNLGNHTIDGSLYLGPTATYGGGGTVTGTIHTDANINFPDIILPNVTWSSAPLSGGIHTFTTSGNYTVADNLPVVVTPGVSVLLNVTTAVSYSPTSIQINGGTTNSGTAYIYLNGPPSLVMAGNSAPDASLRPENLRYYGLPSLTSVTISGTATFTGVLYAPEADITLNGGGSGNDFVGSMVANNIRLNGGYNIHYDVSLSTSGPGYYVANSWQEL
ncbi:MAG: hypothetical protein JF609_03590 [Verrucomicrobia bacterium]|nr:hypothetical protein [Verrucomicrobiota bacterium]